MDGSLRPIIATTVTHDCVTHNTGRAFFSRSRCYRERTYRLGGLSYLEGWAGISPSGEQFRVPGAGGILRKGGYSPSAKEPYISGEPAWVSSSNKCPSAICRQRASRRKICRLAAHNGVRGQHAAHRILRHAICRRCIERQKAAGTASRLQARSHRAGARGSFNRLQETMKALAQAGVVSSQKPAEAGALRFAATTKLWFVALKRHRF
jgi:hypothetical protein